MSKVHILPQDIISKIAAGEVIERPASVIKETIENSLDAGADVIEITLTDAGKTLIQIKDNGSGISYDDIEKIFQRHATSKIISTDDLYNITSLGFRGEALYSIAAISDVTLKSKTSSDENGWQIHIRGGEKLSLQPIPMATKGTIIEVKELFYNTPARKKFLKSNTTELHQILNTFIPYTILKHNSRFLIRHQGKDILDLYPASDVIDRMADVLNIDKKFIIKTEYRIPNTDCHIRMFLGDINISRAKRDMQFLFVNERPVQNKNITYHINSIYRLIMPQDTFPFFAIYINLPARDVDVNIHPMKREVRIKNEGLLCSVLRNICEQAIMQHGQIKQVQTSHENKQNTNHTYYFETNDKKDDDPLPKFYNLPQKTLKTTPIKSPDTPSMFSTNSKFFIPPEIWADNQNNLQKRMKDASYIGTFIKKYMLFSDEKNLLIIDQHAAAERITYERLLLQLQEGKIEYQQLLSPVIINLSPNEIIAWQEKRELLQKSGFSTTQWDKETIAIHSYPSLLADIEKSIRAILADKDATIKKLEDIARIACRSSIMAGDKLNPEEAIAMKKQLLECMDPFTCPHGRPTIIEISDDFLEKQFLRKQ